MKEIYQVKHHTIHLIPPHRLECINRCLQWFLELYEIKNSDWPLDCTKLIRKMRDTQLIPFIYGFFDLSEKSDAITTYSIEHRAYFMQINRNKVRYPFENSNDRRLNFTLAHEIGHIVLEHPNIPLEAKTPEEISLEELEADEFAGRLLLPEKLIYSCNYYSIDSAAEFFNVSKTALWMRLNNMKRLDLFHSRKVRTCNRCGNTHFSTFADFCGICGQTLRGGLRGIKRNYYPQEIQMDRYKRALVCPLCKKDLRHTIGDKCNCCRTSIFNLCSSNLEHSSSECIHANPGNARYCEMCGKPTYYFKRGLISPWQDVLDNEPLNTYYYVAESRCEYIASV